MFRILLSLAGVIFVSHFCLADVLSFWGENSPATNRPASASVAYVISDFSSRDHAFRFFSVSHFRSTGLGLAVYIR